MANEENKHVRLLRELNNKDVAEVGGKNASRGEMVGSLSERGIQVPGGFVTTEKAHHAFIVESELEESTRDPLKQLRRDNMEKVGPKQKRQPL